MRNKLICFLVGLISIPVLAQEPVHTMDSVALQPAQIYDIRQDELYQRLQMTTNFLVVDGALKVAAGVAGVVAAILDAAPSNLSPTVFRLAGCSFALSFGVYEISAGRTIRRGRKLDPWTKFQ